MKERRVNPISPIERIFVGRQEAADLLSISVGLFDQLVREGTLPSAHTYFHSLPMWDVAKLVLACRAIVGQGGKEYESTFPEPDDDQR